MIEVKYNFFQEIYSNQLMIQFKFTRTKYDVLVPYPWDRVHQIRLKFIAEMGHKQSGLRTMEYSLDVEKTNKEKVTIFGLISISIL